MGRLFVGVMAVFMAVFLAVFELNSLNLGNNRKIRRIETLFFLTVGLGIFE